MNLLVLVSIGLVSQVASSGDPTVEAIQTAFAANRTAFQYGTVRFRLNVGYAKNLESALRGDLSPSWRADGSYTFDGTLARYEMLFPPEVMVAARHKSSADSWTSPLSSRRSLTNGRVTLWDRIDVDPDDDQTVLHTAQIDRGIKEMFDHNFIFPLKLGASSYQGVELDKEIERVRNDSSHWRFDQSGVVGLPDNPEVVRLTFHGTGPPRAKMEFLADLSVGAIPRETVYTIYREESSEESQIIKQYSDIRSIEGRGWFPFAQTVVHPEGSDGRRFVQRLIVEEANFDDRPDSDAFRMEFPEPRPLINASTMIRYPAQAVWDLDHLPSLGKAGVERITMAGPNSTAPTMPKEQDSSRWWIIPAILLAFSVTAAGTYLYRKRRHG